MLFNFNVMCTAEKLLRVPNVTYIIRPRAGSISREKENFDVPKHLHKWISVLKIGADEFEKIMSRIEFFKEHSDYRYTVIDFFFRETLHMIPLIYSKVPAFKLQDLVKKEFHDNALAAYMFNSVNVCRLQIMRLQQEINNLKNHR